MSVTLPYFGAIDIDELSDYYQADYNYEGKNIPLDLNFDDTEISSRDLEDTVTALQSLPQLISTAYIELKKSFQTNGVVKQYINRHMSGLSAEQLDTLFTGTADDMNKEQKMLSQLKIVRIGFYPEDILDAITIDFSLGYDLTDIIIVMNFNSKMQLEDIGQES